MAKAKPKKPSLDELEAVAYSDLVAAMESGDEEAGRAALKDFVVACIERNEGGEYEGK
jgi:hypothetical protein